MDVQEDRTGTEAGKLQADLKDVFSKMLSHARRIDITMTLGDSTEALGQLRGTGTAQRHWDSSENLKRISKGV